VLKNENENQLILIVDDAPKNLQVLGSILKKEGYQIVFANSGVQALDYISKQKPDLILLDIMMPGMDGYEVCKILKNDEKTELIPIIFVTAKVDSESIIKGLDYGAIDYVTKPFKSKEILLRVENHLKIQRLKKSLIEKNEILSNKQKIILKDLEAAAEIQRSLIPDTSFSTENIDMSVFFLPCAKVGGDILNYKFWDNCHMTLFVLDVMGHGVASAMISLLVSQFLNQRTFIMKNDELLPPDEVLRKLDREFPLERHDRYFTIFYMVFNTSNGELIYSNAGHPRPIILRQNNRLESFSGSGTVIGMGEPVPFPNKKTVVRPGEKIFLYSDGIIEEKNEEEILFGLENIEKILSANSNKPINQICDAVMNAVKKYTNKDEFRDDITLMGLEFKDYKK